MDNSNRLSDTSLAKHQQISKKFKINYNNIRELLYEKVKDRIDETFLILLTLATDVPPNFITIIFIDLQY